MFPMDKWLYLFRLSIIQKRAYYYCFKIRAYLMHNIKGKHRIYWFKFIFVSIECKRMWIIKVIIELLQVKNFFFYSFTLSANPFTSNLNFTQRTRITFHFNVQCSPEQFVCLRNWIYHFFVTGLGFELSTSHILGRHSTTWATSPVLLLCFLCFFEIGSLELFVLAGIQSRSSWSLPPE
jgi:hypothetical protein